MGKRQRTHSKPTSGNGISSPQPTIEPLPPPRPTSRWISWLSSPWAIVLILALGAAIRIWGITERHFVDPDTAGHHMGGEVFHLTWRWHHEGIDKTMPLLDYLDQEMGTMAVAKFDNGKPLNLIFRAACIFIAGKHSLLLHTFLDTIFGLLAMGLMLHWCHKNLGPRITLMAGCLWLVNGFHFQCTGRGFEYSAMMLFGTLGWLAFMKRGEGHLYRQTFLAGLSLGAGITYHYSFFNYLPLLAIFLLLFRNPAGIKGKLQEVSAFVAGFAVIPMAIIAFYQWLTWVTGTPWKWEILSPLFQQGNTFGDMHISLGFFKNAWFLWPFLNGYLFMFLLFTGIVVLAILHVRRYGWHWAICEDPMFILNGVVAYGLLVWGIYAVIVPRAQTPELATWPVVAAIGLHYTTRLACAKLKQGQALNVLQTFLIAVVMTEQCIHMAPMIKMGTGFRKAMMAISAEGKTATGEGFYNGIWPCTSRPIKPAEPTPPLTRWECLDDYLTGNGYDYFYAHYGRLLTHMVMYPGAGHPLMLDTYNRLIARTTPVWHFEYGAPIYARVENMNMGWVIQTRSMEAWREASPQPNAYDLFVERQPYLDVFRAKDVVAAFRESRVHLLAQLMTLQRQDPNRFQQIAPRFHSFIQYNATNAVIMQEAQAASARR